MNEKFIEVNGKKVFFENERNLLEVIRKAGIDIPNFCYHSELSIYGACRLCLIEVNGKEIMASCSTVPKSGMIIKTETKEIRKMRKINIELLLANHNRECPSCTRSSFCALQDMARRLGVEEIRYKKLKTFQEIDNSSPSLTRDPNKCVLCGDCVRVCKEVQGIGAIDFIHRGALSEVAPAFGQNLADTECVNCGQCASVCPTGAIIPKQDRNSVWQALLDNKKTVVAQVAPAVRVAMGEYFGFKPGENIAGIIVSALKMLGFKYVYDTSFSADMTIFEEGTELIERLNQNKNIPLFTSCCPAWVKYAETFYPELLPNISTCRSPQQMFGALARDVLPKELNIDAKDLVIVSIMPCTAKKYEASLPRYQTNGTKDVDYVLTTIELGKMIGSMGIQLTELEPESFDMPFGFATGGGVIFGNTGGVMEASLRFASEKITGKTLNNVDFKEVRGKEKIKEACLKIGDNILNVAVVHGLKEAGEIAKKVVNGDTNYHFIEIMACKDGCVCGAGQPIQKDKHIKDMRTKGLYHTDKTMQVQKSQDNYFVDQCYKKYLGNHPASHKAHERLHTLYKNRSQLFDAKISILKSNEKNPLDITVTVCANQENCPGKTLLSKIVEYIKENGWTEKVNLDAAFSSRQNLDGTICVTIGNEVLENCKYMNALNTEEEILNTFAFKKIREAINHSLSM